VKRPKHVKHERIPLEDRPVPVVCWRCQQPKIDYSTLRVQGALHIICTDCAPVRRAVS
jgi:hypothetical protein